ncbi:MAG: CDP-alcohol phosphatidyltransferase family protein [Rhodoluna sp.]
MGNGEQNNWWQQAKTPPNLISFLRLALVPVFVYLLVTQHNLLAILVLATAGITDFLDGYLARKLNQVTRLGQLLDPFADRLYILATLIGLSVSGVIPVALALVIIARDLILAISYPILATHGYGPLPVHYLGKAGTFALMYAFPLLLIANIWQAGAFFLQPLAWAFSLWGAGLYWWAGIVYLRQVREVVKIGV